MHLGERKQRILGAVVREYVETVRPVGSEELAARHAWGVKSATIRNELAELADMGLLRQPHTSAGRIPSDLGYRFYVDNLMQVQPIARPAARRQAQGDAVELDFLLRRTCTLLARMTSYTAVATPPRPADVAIADILLSPTTVDMALLTILLSSGEVSNRLLPKTPDVTEQAIGPVARAARETFAGRSVSSFADGKVEPPPAGLPEDARPLFKIVAQVVASAMQQQASEDDVVIEGSTEIMRQPEFRESSKVEGVMEALQRGTLVFQMTGVRRGGGQFAVVIGTENVVEAMQDCSIVSAPYYAGTRERGSIGVVGPTRMDYDRAVPAVQFFARALSDMLTPLGVQ